MTAILLSVLVMLVFIKIVSDFDKHKEGIKTLTYILVMLVIDFLVLCTQY